MNSFPYFPFYPADWLSDIHVSTMSFEEKGAYITLLCHCWAENGLDPKTARELISSLNNESITKVIQRFNIVKGLLRNKRLDEEKKKILARQKKRSTAGKMGMESRWREKSNKTKEKEPLQRNNNVITNDNSAIANDNILDSDTNIKEEKNTPYIPLAEFLAERLKVNVPFQKIPENYQDSWSNDFRLMVEADKIPIDRIREVLDWATTDEFWKVNIRSGSKFRKQFGVLEAKSRSISKADIRETEIQRERQLGAGPEKPPEEKAAARYKHRQAMEFVRQMNAKWEPLIEAAKTTEERTRLRDSANAETQAGIRKIHGYEVNA